MSASVDLVCVPPDQAAQFWPFVRDLIARAATRTNLSHSRDIERETLEGNGLLWLAIEHGHIRAAGTTVLQRTDAELVCVCTSCAGEPCDWRAIMDRVENYARAEGCARVRIYGRRGWERVLDGYHAEHVILEKEIA